MKKFTQTVKDFVQTHKKKLILGSGIALGALILLTVIMLFIYNLPKDAYQAVKACDLFTPAEAQDLLGDNVISVDSNAPVVADNTATSKCSYTDRNADKGKMKVAAIAVRTGINNKGMQQNKTEFAASKPSVGAETVKNLGDSAYFDKSQGQLNILRGHEWIILSYGVGATPEENTLGDATKLAQKVLN